jgi:hypothetical protein
MRVSRGIDFWKEHCQAYEAAALTQAEYCAKHKLSRKTFEKWRSIIKLEATQEAARNAPPQLIRVDAQRTQSPGSPGHGAARAKDAGIALRSPGWEIRLEVGFDVDSLCHVLRALRYY